MPSIADFTIVSDTAFELPDPQSGINDRHFTNVSFPEVTAGSRGVLMFRVDPKEPLPVTVSVRINNERTVLQEFDTTQQRTWHEVIGAGVLKPTGNEIVVSVPSTSQGSAAIGDIVVHFQANVSLVATPG